MSLTAADVKKLNEPFPADKVGVKVQSLNKLKTSAMLVCYLQHTDVYSRLDAVDPAWSAEVTHSYTVTEASGSWTFVRVKLTVKGVSRENAGEGEDPKSATSDAIKRAAMLFGVGRYLYDTETVWVPYSADRDYGKSWTLEEFHRALKSGQQRVPTQNEPAPRTQSSEPPVKPAGTPKPMVAPRAAPAQAKPAPETPMALGQEILRIGALLNMTPDEVSGYANEQFNKPTKQLSIPELKELLVIFQKEAGSRGITHV